MSHKRNPVKEHIKGDGLKKSKSRVKTYCWHCNKHVIMKTGSIWKGVLESNGVKFAKGLCGRCGYRTFRFYTTSTS